MAKAHTIAIIANTAWNIYNFRRDLYYYLKESGYEVVTLGAPDRYSAKLIKEGIRFVPLNDLVPSNVSWLKDIDFLKELSRKIKNLHPDLLLLFTAKPNIYGNIVAARLDIPTLSTLTGVGSVFTLGGWRAKGVASLYKIALKHASRIVFHNSDDMRLFHSEAIIGEDKGLVIPGSGIRTEKISFSPLPQSSKRTILLMARMIEDKGIRAFMKASASIAGEDSNTHFIMIGNRPEKDKRTIPFGEIKEWTSHEHCNYHDFVEDVFPYIEKAHIVVLPSWREGLPRVVLEAMAVGRPVVATDVPGCRQAVLNNKSGILIPPRDPEGLYQGLKDMLSKSDEALAQMGKEGRARAVQQFDSDIINENYLKIIKEALPFYTRLYY